MAFQSFGGCPWCGARIDLRKEGRDYACPVCGCTFNRNSGKWKVGIPLALLMEPAEGVETMERQALQSAILAGLVREGDVVVITAGLPLHVPGTTNTVKVAVAGRKREPARAAQE